MSPLGLLRDANQTKGLNMFNISVPIWELVVRSVVVFVFLLALLRVTGKRQVGQLAPFDLVLLLVLSNAVQNSMNGGDNSLVGGLISAVTLVALNAAISFATYRSKKLEAIIEGRPQVLIHNGVLFEDVMASAQLTHHELNAALRRSGYTCVAEVHSAVLENNGAISVAGRHASNASPAMPEDIASLVAAKLATIIGQQSLGNPERGAPDPRVR